MEDSLVPPLWYPKILLECPDMLNLEHMDRRLALQEWVPIFTGPSGSTPWSKALNQPAAADTDRGIFDQPPPTAGVVKRGTAPCP